MAYATAEELSARITLDGGTPPSAETLSALLDKAKGDIDAYCKRDFDKHSDAIVILHGSGSERYLLPYYPVITISNIALDGEDLSADMLSRVVWFPWGIIQFPSPVAKGTQIAITMEYGYETPPALVKEATLRLASRYARIPSVMERNAVGMSTEKLGDYSSSFSAGEIDKDIAVLLAGVRRAK